MIRRKHQRGNNLSVMPHEPFLGSRPAWLETQTDRLLPCPYFLVTFTLPAGLRDVARAHQREKILDTLTDRPVHDLSASGTVAAALALLRRPRGLVVTDNKRQAALLRLTGNHTVTVQAVADGTLPSHHRC